MFLHEKSKDTCNYHMVFGYIGKILYWCTTMYMMYFMMFFTDRVQKER